MGFTRKLPVAKEGEIQPGEARTFRFGVQNGIAYNDEGTLKAYVNFCTHAGGPLKLVSPTVFRCQWHESDFDPKTGVRLCGQAPEGTKLKPIDLVVEAGQVYAILEIRDEFE